LPSRKRSHGYGKSTRICGSFLNGKPGFSIAMSEGTRPGKPEENHGKTMGKPWENHGKMVIYMENGHRNS